MTWKNIQSYFRRNHYILLHCVYFRWIFRVQNVRHIHPIQRRLVISHATGVQQNRYCVNLLCLDRNRRKGNQEFTCIYISELSTGQMDPRFGSGRVTILSDWRVGSGHDFGRLAGRVGSALRLFLTKYLLVPVLIWIFEYYIQIDCFSRIFN